jgi:hypothetical protein
MEPGRRRHYPGRLFAPSDLAILPLQKKCHPACPGVPWDRTRISCYAALDIAA